MKQAEKVGSLASGVLVLALGWAACAALPEAPARVEASSLALNPQMAWARAVEFSDVIESLPVGHPHRLGERSYLSMHLKEAGLVWVSQERAPTFQNLAVGGPLLFDGTVEEFSHRYHIIVSDVRAVPASGEASPPGPDSPHSAESGETHANDLSALLMETLLADANNSLNQLAEVNNVTVAQFIEAQSDGGRGIAEGIVADSLHGQSKGANSTAEELMVGVVLSLLRMPPIAHETAQASEGPPDPAPASSTELSAEVVDIAVWDAEILIDEPLQAEIPAEISFAAEEPIPLERSVAEPDVRPEMPREMVKEFEPMPDIEPVSVEFPSVEIQPVESVQVERSATEERQAYEAEAARLRKARQKAAEEKQAAAQARIQQLAAEENARLAAEEKARLAAEEKARLAAEAKAKRAAALEKKAEEKARRAEQDRQKKEQQHVRAEAARLAAHPPKSTAESDRSSEPSELPEWMHPVWFEGDPSAEDKRAAEEKQAAAHARTQQLAAEEKARFAAVAKANLAAEAKAKRAAARAKKSEPEPEQPVDPAQRPAWLQPIGY